MTPVSAAQNKLNNAPSHQIYRQRYSGPRSRMEAAPIQHRGGPELTKMFLVSTILAME